MKLFTTTRSILPRLQHGRRLLHHTPKLGRSALSLLSNTTPLLDTPLTRMIREHENLMDETFSRFPFRLRDVTNVEENTTMKPRYEIVMDNDTEFKIAVDVPGLKMDDIKVHYDDEKKILMINGLRESKGDGYFFSSKFSQHFAMDPAVQVDQLAAHLENGVLIISAPKDVQQSVKNTIRQIPVVTGPSSTGSISGETTIPINNEEEK
jgi:HSP20 family protein